MLATVTAAIMLSFVRLAMAIRGLRGAKDATSVHYGPSSFDVDTSYSEQGALGAGLAAMAVVILLAICAIIAVAQRARVVAALAAVTVVVQLVALFRGPLRWRSLTGAPLEEQIDDGLDVSGYQETIVLISLVLVLLIALVGVVWTRRTPAD